MADFYVDSNGKVTKRKKKDAVAYVVNADGSVIRVDEEEEDIAPVRQDIMKREEDDSKLDFFQKSKAFDDGWQFGDLAKTILGTVGDAGLELVKGVGGLVEGVTDAVSYGVAGITDVLGADEFAERTRKRAQENKIEQWTENLDNRFEQNSILGRTSDAILQGVGQVGGIMATGGIAGAAGLGTAGATALTTGLMGVSGFGSGAGEAYRGGATDEEAMTYGLISGASDALTELIFGGLGKAVGAVGLSTGLSSADDLLAKKVSGLFSNQIAKNFAEFGIKAGAEGFEEVLAGVSQAIGKKITYMDEEELSEILKDENLLEQFVVGAATSGMIQSGIIPGTSEGSLKEANATGRDFITGFTQAEQSVIDKEVEKRVAEQEKGGKKLTKKEIGKIEKTVQEDMDKGFISIDTIEEVLGGETYTSYKKVAEAEDAMQREYDELGKKEHYTLADDTRYRELADRLKYVREKGARSELKKRLDTDVASMVEGSRLAESFRERERRGQTFEADVTQYDAKQQAIVQKAIDSGILNNTRRTHEFVDMVARIAADRGLSLDFTNNSKLKESGFAVEGKTVNGFVTKDGITVNIQSAKSLNSVVGHEITHVLEGTELYTELQKAVFQYAESKKDLAGRRGTLTALYQNIEDADIDAELTADLVGDYLFTDSDFINNLSTNHRNVFQKIYDEVKYLLKVATAGSKEARELEKVKRAFEKAYREGGKKAAEDGGTKYSITETTDGRIAAVVDNDILASIDTTSWDNTKKEAAKKAASEALKQFSGGIVVDGITRKVNRVSRNEYTRSNYTESLYNHAPDVFADKMRAAEVADDIVVAATNWTRDGGLDHPRTDNFVDFDHGTALIVSGDAKYTAEVVVGITAKGEAVFYDVVDLTPATFDTKKAEPPTTATTQDAIGDIHGDSADGTVSQDGGNVKYSLVEDQGTIDFLENQEHLTVYKAMALIDGKLYPPMASQTYVDEEYTTKSGEKKTRRVRKLKSPSVLGRWQQAEENPGAITSFSSKGYGQFDLLKSNGKTTGGVAYNPYEHTSNIVLNDQFSEAYQRPELVTVEYQIPVSELTSGYKAQYAKDAVGLTDWKAGGVAQKLKHSHRDVYLTRWSKPVRVLSDAEVAQKYKEILDNEDGVSVPWNVVTPSLRTELERIGVPIDYSDIKAGSTVRSFEAAMRGDYEKPKKGAKKSGAQFSLSEIESAYQADIENGDMIGAELAVERAANLSMPDSKIRGADGNLIPVYHGTREMFYEFDTSIKGGANGTAEGFGIYTSDDPEVTAAYGNRQIKMYANITKPATSDKKTISPAKLAALIKATCKKQAQQAVEDGEYDSVQDALMDTWVSNYVYTYDIGMERAYREVAKSILQMNDSDMAVIQEVMSGMAIRDYAEATAFYRDYLIPITGFDGFVTHWENSATGKKSNIYLAFDSSQLKSADAVTYDDNGNVIPLSERFDPEKKDIRRSLSPENAQRRTFGNYNVYGSDVALEEDIAPVRQDIAPVAVANNATTTDIAPATVSKNATVQEAAVYEEPEQGESPYAEIDRLTEEAEELERRMYAAMDAGDNEAAMEINADLVDAAVRITELEQQLDAAVQDRLASFEDADAPAVREAPYSESTDTVTLPKKMVQSITKEAREALGFSARRSAEMRQLIEKFSQGEIDSEMLYDEIAERFGRYTETERLEDIAEVKTWLRTVPLHVTDEIKADFADYTASVMRPNFGKIRFSKTGASVDLYYDELNAKYPGFFPSDIIQTSDQLQRIIEVANMGITTEQVHELDGQTLDAVTDSIVRLVNEYRREQRRILSEQNSRAAFNSLMADGDRYAPIEEGDIAPVRADVAAEPAAEPVAEPAQESAPEQIKTVKERLAAKLQNLQTELAGNQRLREESRASYDEEIARLQAEYDAKRDKNTKAANNLLRRIERLRRVQSDIDADYEKRINDLAERTAKASEEARTGESPEAQGAMRRELHASIVESIRFRMAERGIDFDEMLRNAKDLSTLATVDNTPQRVMEKALGYKAGQALADLTVNQVAQHETEGIHWLNGYTNRKSGLLAQISKQYRIKPGSKESAAAQMYAEGFYVAENGDIIAYGDRELAADFPDAQVQANIKGLARDPRIRQIYDATLAMINESRARNAYPEIQRLDNYFLHFRAMDDTFSRLGIPFNPNDIRAKDLPTDLNGVTADLKPGQPYFASAMHRRGKRTSFDLLGGLERYLTSAKGQIYHIDDIQTLRALRNHIAETYGQAHGLEGLDTMTEEEAAAQIEQVYDAHLSTFAKFLNEEANVIAGKTALIDRGLEGIIGRRGMTFFDTLNRQVGANMVGFNVSSSLTNFIAPVQAFAKTNKAAFVKGFAQTVANRVGAIAGKTDGFMENNPTMIRRQGADQFYRTPWQKAADLGYAMMGAVDSLSTEIIVRSKYNELVSKGMSHEQAVTEADKWTSRLMGDRSLGQQPQLYNSKMLGIITKFQLEVRNQLDSQFYDTIQEAKVSAEDIQNKQARNAKIAAQVTSTFVQLAVVQHLFGKAFEAVAGYNPAFDIIEAIIKAFGWDDEEDSEDTVLDNLGQGFMNLLEDMPYSSVATGGRIPIASALPVAQLIKGEDKYGNEKSRLETLVETAPYYLLPGGYGQIKKTTQGLGMFDDDLPIAGSYTDSGNLRYPVEDTLANRAQAAIFGQYASANARDYFDNERQSLKKNQIQELVDVDIPIREYWDYREGLADQETLADKFDYIAGLDLPIDKKNILINNVVDRKEAVDLTDYDDYADYEEFDFAVKNPEKYDFLQSVGVSVAQYQSFDDDTKDAYDWAYQNPEKYTLSRAVADDVAVYRQYTKALNEIKADKYADGRTVTGSRKTKVLDYLNNLDADYYSKIILFKMEYNADDTYNREIIEYLNGRSDISFEEEVTILRELGFTVTADGTVRW